MMGRFYLMTRIQSDGILGKNTCLSSSIALAGDEQRNVIAAAAVAKNCKRLFALGDVPTFVVDHLKGEGIDLAKA